MTTPIGRAGKQVFSAVDGGAGGLRISPQNAQPAEISPKSGLSSPSIPSIKLPPKPANKPSPPPPNRNPPGRDRDRRDSEDWNDLEKTIEQCKNMENEPPAKSPIRNAPSSSSSARDLETPPFPLSAKLSSPMNTSAFLSPTFSKQSIVQQTVAATGIDGNKKVADLEKEELLAALEVLKMQNQMLTNRIEKNQNESRLQVEHERQQRIIAIHTLEQQNKELIDKLIQSKHEAEAKLEEEKATFAAALHSLETERNQLQTHLEAIERQSAEELEKLRSERSKMEKDILSMELEKEQMFSRVLQIEALNDSESLQSEMEGLKVHLQQLELEKENLKLQMELNDQQLNDEKKRLQERLEKERGESQERLRAIEAQRLEANARFAEAKATASQQSEAALEKINMLQRKGSGMQLDTILEGAPTTSEKKQSNRAEAKKKAKALQDKLKSRKKERQLSIGGSGGSSKERISAGVSRMRANFEQEKLRSQQNSNNSSTNDLHSVHSTMTSDPSKVVLEAKKSLFDMFNISASGSADFTAKAPFLHPASDAMDENRYEISSNLPQNIYSQINKIYEGLNADDNTRPTEQKEVTNRVPEKAMVKEKSAVLPSKTMFDLDSDDEDDEEHRAGKKDKAKEQEAAHSTPPSVPLSTTNATIPGGTTTTTSQKDLPEGHAAAARGDLNKLKDLIMRDPAVLDSLDVSHRPVIFYAAVHGHVNIIIYLLQLYSNNIYSIFQYDLFGDSIIHAAVCSNNPVCLELILSKLDKIYQDHADERLEILNHRNSYGMTAVHMANNVACLELLYKYGADVSIVDGQNRTPLFIFCLLNNEKCVNFLINSYDSIEYIYKADYRGDTPLHAAACNGSVECLLTLLQQGIDPRMVNNQNLRAVDLAVRNKQNKCRDILAEYLLHYCTSSDFDSVLFLSTLEGHRYIAQNVHKLPPPKPIQRGQEGGNSDGPDTAALPKMLNNQLVYPSLFTLRDAKTMRLERYGDWIAYHDPYTHQVFWYNHQTSSGQWEVPSQVLEYQQHQHALELKGKGNGQREGQGVEDEEDERFGSALQSKMSMRMKRRGDWIEYSASGAPTIYYNEKDGSFTWEDPHDPNSSEANRNVDYEEYAIAHESHQGRYEQYYAEEDAGQAFTYDPAYSCDYNPERDGRYEQSVWQPFYDDSTGSIYWYNSETTESQWENPYGQENDQQVLDMALMNSRGESAYGAGTGYYDQELAVPVDSLHDLGLG